MRTRRNRLVSLVLALTMALGLAPALAPGAQAATADYTLYFKSTGDGGLYTDEDCTTPYTGQSGKWSVDGDTLTLDGFDFQTTAMRGLVVLGAGTVVLAPGSKNVISTTYIGDEDDYYGNDDCAAVYFDATSDYPTITGGGTLTINNSGSSGYSKYRNGLYARGGLILEDVTVSITAEGPGRNYGLRVGSGYPTRVNNSTLTVETGGTGSGTAIDLYTLIAQNGSTVDARALGSGSSNIAIDGNLYTYDSTITAVAEDASTSKGIDNWSSLSWFVAYNSTVNVTAGGPDAEDVYGINAGTAEVGSSQVSVTATAYKECIGINLLTPTLFVADSTIDITTIDGFYFKSALMLTQSETMIEDLPYSSPVYEYDVTAVFSQPRGSDLGVYSEEEDWETKTIKYALFKQNGEVADTATITGGGDLPVYTVSFVTPDEVDAIPDQQITAGGKVTRPEDPARDDGMLFEGWFLDSRGNDVFDFDTKVYEDITLYAVWTEDPFWLPFTDVSPDDWFFDDVKYVYDRGLMDGVDDDTFAPNSNVTRGMVVTVLWRGAGKPLEYYDTGFTDLEQRWYRNAIEWATYQNVVEGYGDGRFGPEDDVTREQLAAILYRDAERMYMDVSARNDLSSYTDGDKVSDWALEAMQWANATGLITGKDDNSLSPTDGATRAEYAAMINRYHNYLNTGD